MTKVVYILLCLSLIASVSVAAVSVKKKMTVSKDLIGLDEQVLLVIKVVGNQRNMPQPQMPNMSLFDVTSRGSSTNISIINGQMESSVSYNYLLFPRKKGNFIIKPAVVVLNRKRYESNEVTITVVATPTAPGQSNRTPDRQATADAQAKANKRDVFLTAFVNKKSSYVNEQITLTVKFHHAVRLLATPEYTAPQTTDFWSERLEGQDSYTEVVDGRRYNVIEIKTALFPTRSGELEIGSAIVTATIPSNQTKRSKDPFGGFFNDFMNRGENRMIRSRKLKVNVKPLPTEGRPSEFSGTVGSFKVSQSVEKRTVEINQPVTVTYKVNGSGNIKTIAEPNIVDNNDFRVYRANSNERITKINDVLGGTKIFEEVFIPKRAGNLVIPGLDFNFFDPRSKKYRTARTEPINLTVKQPENGDYDNGAYPSISSRLIDSKLKDILYIKTDTDDLTQRSRLILFRPVYMAINIIPILVLTLAIVFRMRQSKFSGDIGYARSRTAKKMAKKRLTKAQKLAGSSKPKEFYAEVRIAIFSYVADKLNISPHGMTGDQLVDILIESNTSESIIDEIKTLLKRADFAQYAPSSVTDEQINQSMKLAEKILVGMEEAKLG